MGGLQLRPASEPAPSSPRSGAVALEEATMDRSDEPTAGELRRLGPDDEETVEEALARAWRALERIRWQLGSRGNDHRRLRLVELEGEDG